VKAIATLPTAVFVAACAGSTPTYPTVDGGQFGGRPVLGISNGTSLTVTLLLNGTSVGSAAPGVGMEPIDFANLPAMPWTGEAKSPPGRVLTSITVHSGDVTAGAVASDNLSTSGTMGRIRSDAISSEEHDDGRRDET
jgi:hypothetical protein